MKSWFLVRGYSKDLIKAGMKKIIFTSKNRNAKRETNHWRRFHLLWLITLNLSQWTKLFLNIKTFFVWTMKLKGCLPLNPWFHSEVHKKLSSYLVRAKLCPTERTIGSYRWGGKRCEVCINVKETSTFTSSVTGETYITNHRFDCNERYFVYLLTCDKSKMQYVGQTVDHFRSRWKSYKNDYRKHGQGAKCMEQHLFNHFVPLATAAF